MSVRLDQRQRRLVIGVAMYAAAGIPGVKYFYDVYIAPGKIGLQSFFCRAVQHLVAEPNRNYETVTHQPVTVGLKIRPASNTGHSKDLLLVIPQPMQILSPLFRRGYKQLTPVA